MPFSSIDDEKLPDRIKQMSNETRRRWVGAFNGFFEQCTIENGEDCEGRAFAIANAAIEEADMERNDFLFFDLESLTPGKSFPGFAAGTFIDMMGREIELKASDLQEFIDNTLARIAEFKERNMPGLPIDARKHDKGDAAGWIVGAELGEVTDSGGTAVPVVHILAEWTKLGAELIRDKIQTNFSPTVDMQNKSIVGGSLTNWPASLDKNGVPLFTAVELAQGIHYLSQAEETLAPESITANDDDNPKWYGRMFADLKEFMNPQAQTPDNTHRGDEPMTIEMTQEQLDELVNGRVKEALAELGIQQPQGDGQVVDMSQLVEAFGLNTDDAEAKEISHLDQLAELVQQQATLQWQQKLARMQRENRYAELSARVTGGTPEAPRGIPADAEALKAELMKLEPEQATFWSGLLESVVKHGLTEFSELGHGRKTEQLKDVPDFAVKSLRATIQAGNSVDEFFALAGLGSAESYDLSQYIEGGK